MDSNHTLHAVFKLLTYELTITVTDGGTTDPPPGIHTYINGTVVSVVAIPYEHYEFVYWELDGVNVGSDNPIEVIMDQDHLLHAVFTPKTYYLTIFPVERPSGTTDPPAGTYVYVAGTEVNVTAIPDPGFSFDYWLLDGEKRTENPITITMDANHTLVPYFVDDIPPEIGVPMQDPPADNVQPFQEVRVSVSVTDLGSGLRNVTIIYGYDENWIMTLMSYNSSTDLYEAKIPGYPANTTIKYKIVAYDNAGNKAQEDNAGQYYVYTVIPEFSTYATAMALLALTLLVIILRKKS